MTGIRIKRTAASALALGAALGLGSAAQAQVTAQQVWDDWKAGLAMTGEGAMTIGSETADGGVVTVTDLGFNATGDDGTVITGNLPSLVFTENGDGTVAVTMAEEYPITIASPGDAAAGEAPTDIVLALRQQGLTVTVSGQPGALSYDLAARRYALELDSVTREGTEAPAEAMLALNDLSGTYTSTIAGESRDIDYDIAAASMDLLLDVTNPEDGSTLTASGKLADLASQATMTMPADMTGMDDAAMQAAMMESLSVDGGYSTGAGEYLFEFADASGPTSGTVTVAGSRTDVNFSGEALGYDASAMGIAVNVTSAMMPFPIAVTLAEYGVNFQMPLAKTDAPADWALGLNITELDINDEVWALFDPNAVLPRDPATLVMDLAGTATLLFDITDPAQEAAMAAAPTPAQIDSLAINALDLSAAGAQVTGTGAFTFDNADMTTIPGMPRPEGSAEFQLNGVNGLIDKLVDMGLIPPDQVMGARMMLGLIAVPGEGDDQLVSRIEVTADGQVLANGQRLR